MVDYRAAFAALHRDPRWMRKIGVGALIQLIPYVGMVWMIGWNMEYQRNVAWGRDDSIPDWSDFGGQVGQGFRAVVAVLPYSIVMSLLLVPVFVAVPLLGIALEGSNSAGTWVVFALAAAASVIVYWAITVLLIPLTSSIILRVALYGTFESGFQYREIWRLMRERRSELMRAWGFTTINLGISFVVGIICFGILGLLTGLVTLLLALLLSSLSELAFLIASLALGVIGSLGSVVLVMALGLYLGLANAHYFGTYGRTAYRLGSTGIRTAATSIETQSPR